jgi:hypothetical protein
MFNSPIIDLALTLSFTYFSLSLTVSTIHEYLSALLNKRGEYLKNAIQCLLFDQDWKKIAEKLYNNPNITSLKKDLNSLPSYIPAGNFATALMDQFKNDKNIILDMNTIRAVLTDDGLAAQVGISEGTRKLLLNFYERAQGDLQNFQKQIETFYNSAMDRASGVYKRSSQLIVFIISLTISASFNVDTINIVNKLWSKQDVLKHTADNLQNAVDEANKQGYNPKTDKIEFGADKITVIKKNPNDTTTTAPDGKKVARQVSTVKTFMDNTGIPVGWTAQNTPDLKNKTFCQSLLPLLVKIAGILLTALALMLGAPFWFDLINKIVSLRSAGKKPEEEASSPAKNTTVTVKPVG